jgi:CheY-like chemotaxis protein
MAKSKTVLFYDDERFISKLLAKNLRVIGWHVDFVNKIDELFMELSLHQYDILIIDIMAPVPAANNKNVSFTINEIKEMDGGMNTGVVIAKKIWDKIREDQPILFLSAKRQTETIKTIRIKRKKCGYLRKPELARNIDRELHELLGTNH